CVRDTFGSGFDYW
nr:immunoglobulin heavy chain junction region [Macaca mulatta]MOX59229.1 immunoglobulin heavy chain junction region [Macaca mulatta]MOX59286.1 immunoglobulin heavy chain junction region [Macaca mulatta]MOX60288.1 immunoglobulin heavy chain junction region [Macaca mulatta]MOX60445.1 immunoglobulin heavy chain junction region [Macaca mulatta]